MNITYVNSQPMSEGGAERLWGELTEFNVTNMDDLDPEKNKWVKKFIYKEVENQIRLYWRACLRHSIAS